MFDDEKEKLFARLARAEYAVLTITRHRDIFGKIETDFDPDYSDPRNFQRLRKIAAALTLDQQYRFVRAFDAWKKTDLDSLLDTNYDTPIDTDDEGSYEANTYTEINRVELMNLILKYLNATPEQWAIALGEALKDKEGC